VNAGAFRKDLYYRLGRGRTSSKVPPLRATAAGVIEPLARQFAGARRWRRALSPPPRLARLVRHDWPRQHPRVCAT
jgi:transcriptional regulator with PAS, ATPase and Fis domain